MKSFFAAASLVARISAAAIRRGDSDTSSCSFQIISSGGVNGVMGQYEDGQNRLNGSYPPATYHYSNGGIVDQSGRGCIVTLTNDATHQFQCDLNTAPTDAFSISHMGSISFQGSDQFYACPYITQYNVYTQWLQGQDKCVPIKLSTNATCAAASRSSGASSASGYGAESSQVSRPGYVSESTLVVIQSTPVQVVPGYGSSTSATEASPVESTSVPVVPAAASTSVIEASPVRSTSIPVVPAYGGETSQGSVPGYGSQPTSAPVETVPIESTVSITEYESASVVSYPALSSPAQLTVTQSTTVLTTDCSETEISISSGTTVYYTHQTQSIFTSVVTPSVPAPSDYAPAATPSSSAESVSTPVVSTSVAQSQATEAPSPSSPVSIYTVATESTTFTEDIPSSTTSGTTYATSWSIPAGNISVTSPIGTASTISSYSHSYSQLWSTSSPIAPSGTQPAGYGSIYSAPSSAVPATSTTASACQTSLEGAYQTPHLITWTSKSYPDTSYGSQYNATVNEDCSTIMNFDIPSDYAGKTCSVIFLFPKQEDLETSAWTWNQEGGIQFDSLSGVATDATTYNNAPAINGTLNTINIEAGNSYVVSTGACAAGTTESIELSSSNGLQLEFFEDWNPSSLGLYITAC